MRLFGDLDRKNAAYVVMAAFTVLVMAGFLVFYWGFYEKTYSGYTKTELLKLRETIMDTVYLEDKLIRTSPDGAELMDLEMNSLAKLPFEMESPKTLVNGSYALIIDQGGREAFILDGEGKQTELKLENPIVAGAVSPQGAAAFILDGSDNVCLSGLDGELKEGPPLSASQTAMAVCFAGSGKTLAISEAGIELGDAISTVSFYNINGDPIKTGELAYEGTLIPSILPLKNGRVLLAGDDRVMVVRADVTPREIHQEVLEGRILKAKSESGLAALLLEREDGGREARVYGPKGRQLVLEPGFLAEGLSLSDGQVILFDSTRLFLAGAKAKIQFEGELYQKASIRSVLRVGRSDYRISTEYGVDRFSFY